MPVSGADQKPVPAKAEQPSSSPHKDEEGQLNKRVLAAQKARDSGNPEAISQANRHVIASALFELGQLRAIESAYPQAAELYQRSLEIEDNPEAHLALAIAQLQSNKPDLALAEANKILGSDPNNIRALNIQGRAWQQKGDYSKAAELLERSEKLKPDVETLYSIATCLLQSKTPEAREKSATIFQKMIKMAGNSGSLHVLFGRAYREANDMPSAIHEFERAVQLDPRTPHAYYFLALARMANNEWKPTPEIKAGFLKELEFYPHDYLANYMVGFIASSERDYQLSDKYLQASVDVNPDWPEPWLYMGLNAYAQNNFDRAEQVFRKAIELTGSDESRSNFQIRRAYVDLGRILVNSGRSKEAETYLAKARDLQNKVLQDSQQGMAEMVASGGAGSAAAIVPLSTKNEAAMLTGPTDPFARVSDSVMAKSGLTPEQRAAADSQEQHLRAILGVAFNDLATSQAVQKQYVQAFANYQEAERWDENISGLSKNLGLCAFRTGQYSEAIRGLSKALQETPTDGPIRAMLGMAYFGLNKYSDTAATFSPLGTAGMQDPLVGYAWAVSLARTGNLKKAGEVLSNFQQGARTDQNLLLIGQLWIEIGDYSQAVAACHRALQQNSSLLRAHYFAGQADIRWEHWPEAESEFKGELQLDPGSVDAKYNLGFVLLQESNTDQALAWFQEVIGANPDHANAQYQIGKILLDRGQLTEAVEHLEAAARLSPKTDYIHYQLQAAYRKQSRIADADRELAVYKELKATQRGTSAAQTGRTP